MVIVYFESKNHAEEVARYETEQDYIAALPELKKRAAAARMIVTETVKEGSTHDRV